MKGKLAHKGRYGIVSRIAEKREPCIEEFGNIIRDGEHTIIKIAVLPPLAAGQSMNGLKRIGITKIEATVLLVTVRVMVSMAFNESQ